MTTPPAAPARAVHYSYTAYDSSGHIPSDGPDMHMVFATDDLTDARTKSAFLMVLNPGIARFCISESIQNPHTHMWEEGHYIETIERTADMTPVRLAAHQIPTTTITIALDHVDGPAWGMTESSTQFFIVITNTRYPHVHTHSRQTEAEARAHASELWERARAGHTDCCCMIRTNPGADCSCRR